MKYGIIDGGVVTKTLKASYEPSSPWVSIPDEVEAGWLFDGTNYTAPAPVTPPTHRTRLTRLEFRNLFTQAEKQALYTAAQSSIDVQIFLDDLNAAQYVETTDPVTVAGLGALVSAGLLTQARADEILLGLEL